MKIPQRAAVLALALSTAALTLSACGGDSEGGSASGGSITMAIASAVIAPKEEVATFAVAKDQGYFQKEDLTVKTINTDGSSAAVQAVVSGSADITAADAGSILAAKQKGVPIKAIGGLVQNWPWRIAVKPDSPIKSAADLKGKKIGVISLASGSAPYARAFVRQAGLDPAKDVELLPVGVGAQAASAISTNKVDALALYTQAYTTIENSGQKFTYLTNPDMFQGIRSLTFAVREDALEKKKEALTGFLRASYQGMLFSAVNPEAAMKIGYKEFPQLLAGKAESERLASDTKVLTAWIKTATPLTGAPESFANWGAIGEPEWTKTIAFTKGAGQLTEDLQVSEVYDAGLLANANKFDANAVVAKAKAAQ